MITYSCSLQCFIAFLEGVMLNIELIKNNNEKGEFIMAEITITKDNFENEVLASDIPVVVDFWAAWCGPCKMLAPVLAEFAEENEGAIKVGKVNVDEEGELAAQFGIMSIPTIMVFKNGEKVNATVGFCTKADLEALVD